MNRKPRRYRRGFTLMEVLLVMAILVAMASMATFAYLQIQKNANSDVARTTASSLAQKCDLYKMHVGYFPGKLEDLIVQPQGVSDRKWKGPYLNWETLKSDPWDTPYTYTPDEANNRVEVISAGPDRQSGTDDDISNRDN